MQIGSSVVGVRGGFYPEIKKANGFISPMIAPMQTDSFQLSKSALAPVIRTERKGNALRIAFSGNLQNPIREEKPSIQMKVRGVSAHQKGSLGASGFAKDANVIKLAQSDWKEGRELRYRTAQINGKNIIELSDPSFGPIGRVPDELTDPLLKLIGSGKKGKNKGNQDFKFVLSNVIAGNSKGAPTIGVRVNLQYTGNDPYKKVDAQKTFDKMLNSKDKRISDSVMLYQPKVSPTEVLERIFDVEKASNGPKAKLEINNAITQISKEINNPKNKNILLLGHCKPDGDTLGCVIGMQTAIQGAYPDKHIDCAVDDKIPGLFRDKMPGIESVKRPYNPDRIEMVEKNIETLKAKEQTKSTESQIKIFEKELEDLKNPDKLFDPNPLEGKDKKKYDLVMIMDVPTPKRFTSAFKDYIEDANNVIYIDHHPHRINEWNDAKDETGVDMNQIHENNLALVCDSVPAATQLVTIIADRAGILGKTMQDSLDNAKKFVASVITGTSTDTGSFTRTANLLPEHMKVPVNQRPNFLPEGMSKWLIDELETNSKGQINKKWLRDNITYDVPDKVLSNIQEDGKLSPRDKMLTYALDSKEVNEDLGVGFISIDYPQMYEIWNDSLSQDPDMTLLDVQNGFKYSEVMSALKADPEKVANPKIGNNGGKSASLADRAKEIYDSPYADDKIAILLIQDKKEGYITENSEIATQNGLRLSLRSGGASNHAELLASLFGGGGHGGAAGGRVDLPNVELDTPLCVKIDGEIENDHKKVYEELKKNYDILHDSSLTPEEQKNKTKDIKVALAKDENGQSTKELLTEMVGFIRQEEEAEEPKMPNKKRA
ncbi:MAG: hypothetical protein PHV37_09615 [Candidatus Gastranaerophilales bacterium]|nr:hypothetical protein [Candidatus Gastranaerophilales bacterium]